MNHHVFFSIFLIFFLSMIKKKDRKSIKKLSVLLPVMDKEYYEGVLQLRSPNKEVINFIRNQFKNNSKVWVAKQEKLKTGIDLYISSNKFLLSLGKKLKKSFKGELKISRRLHSRDRMTSKRIYRVTVLFRLL